MRPAVMADDVDHQGDRLQQQAGIEVPAPEKEEEGGRIEVSHPEVVLGVAARQENADQSQDRTHEVYQQHRAAGEGEYDGVKHGDSSLR